MNIDKEVIKELNSFEVSELTRILEALQEQEYYVSGYKNLCGGYATAEAYNVDPDGCYDTEKAEDVDAIEIELESGLQDGNVTQSTKVCLKIPRNVVADPKMTLKEKLQKVEDA